VLDLCCGSGGMGMMFAKVSESRRTGKSGVFAFSGEKINQKRTPRRKLWPNIKKSVG
jgi:ubiquinone/menaquinone biosynthesis C-methylase UbiE